jgi:hypothetical protein
MIRFKPLDATNRDAFIDLLREPWQQASWNDTTRRIAEWRFFNRPNDGSVTWLAMIDNRCVAMLDSMLRPYLLGGKRIVVRETADWYCEPAQRSRGVGLRLLMQMKHYPEPNFVLGGTAVNVDILSKIRGWVTLPSATSFVFPLRVRGLVANVVRRKWWAKEPWAKLIPPFLPAKRPHQIKAPSNASVRSVNAKEFVTLPQPKTTSLTQLFEQQQWEWLLKMPRECAIPLAWEFHINGSFVGFSLAQIEPTRSGLDGRIMFLQTTDPSLLGWVISETTQHLADHGVGLIRTCVSTSSKIAAMKAVGYLKTRDIPCHWWQRKTIEPAEIDVNYLSVDDSYPYWNFRTK